MITKLKKKEVLQDSGKLLLEFDIEPSMKVSTQFDSTEKKRLSDRLDLLEKKLREEYSKSEETSEFIKGQLNYLKTSLERMSKNDWIHTAIGVFITIGVSLGISAANSDKFWQLIKSVLGNIMILLHGS